MISFSLSTFAVVLCAVAVHSAAVDKRKLNGLHPASSAEPERLASGGFQPSSPNYPFGSSALTPLIGGSAIGVTVHFKESNGNFIWAIDTGSPYSFIFGSNCSTCPTTVPHYTGDTIVAGATSQTDTWQHTAIEVQDQVAVGFADATFQFGYVQSIAPGNDAFEGSRPDSSGSFGLGFQQGQQPPFANQTSYFDLLPNAPEPFTFGFKRNLWENQNQSFGWLLFGSNFNAFSAWQSGPIQYTSLLPNTPGNQFWIISVTELTYQGNTLTISTAATDGAIVDTGRPFATLPQGGGAQLFKGTSVTEASGNWIVNCADAAAGKLGTIGVNIAGTSGLFLDLSLLQYPYDGDDAPAGSCVLFDESGNDFEIGLPFLQAFVTVFDAANSRIGFAQRSNL